MKKIIENEKTSNFLIILGILFFIIAITSFLWKEALFVIDEQIDAEKFGQFGDFIGGVVGSFWALAGVVLFYIALVEQRKDIRINSDTLKLQLKALNQQVKEFELQRTELESSRKVYEQQSKTLKLQQFDSNFFSLLEMYMSIKQNLNSLSSSSDYFREKYDEFIIEHDWDEELDICHDNQLQKYNEIYNKNSGLLSNYYRTVYRILKIIESSNFLDENEKDYYSKIFRAQLSDFEQVLLFYNSFSIRGEKTKKLILRYNLFKNIPNLILPYFKTYEKLHGSYNISSLIDDVEIFIIDNLPKYFDMEDEEATVSYLINSFNCIINMRFDPHPIIELHCKKNISDNGICISDDQLLKLFESTVLSLFIFKRYIKPSVFKITKSREVTDDENIFRLTIEFNDEGNFNFRIGAAK